MPRVLFVTTKIGYGHTRVSSTLASLIQRTIPNCETKIVTYFDFFPPRFQSFINTVYIYGLTWFPKVFAYIYLTQKRYKGKGVDFWFGFLGKKYARVIKAYSPDLIVITQGLACQWLGRLKKIGLVNSPLLAIVTDFIVHPFWISPKIDFYMVATEDMKSNMIKRGIRHNKIIVTGIPIDPRFNNTYDRNEIKRKLGLDSKKTTALLLGGGWGLGRMDRLLIVIDKMNLPLELLIVTGKNRNLYRKLKEKNFVLPLHVYGRVENMSELMAGSDLIITKAGGVSVAELLAIGLPAVIWDIIPGQEEANAEFLINNGAAIKIDDIKDVRNKIEKIVLSEDLRKKMAASSERLGNPNSAAKAVNGIKNILNPDFSNEKSVLK